MGWYCIVFSSISFFHIHLKTYPPSSGVKPGSCLAWHSFRQQSSSKRPDFCAFPRGNHGKTRQPWRGLCKSVQVACAICRSGAAFGGLTGITWPRTKKRGHVCEAFDRMHKCDKAAAARCMILRFRGYNHET